MWMIALLVLPPVALFLFIILHFLRSTKEWPRTWRELSIEVNFQFYGLKGFAEDLLIRFVTNRVELVQRPNKIAVITGGNRGIGIAVLEKLLKCGMTVMVGVRNPEGSRKSIENVLGLELTREKVFYEQCDTGDMESVKQFAKNVQQKFPMIHLLINNAGVMCLPYRETKDGFESQMGINYLGHFLLTHLLMPQLIAGSRDNDGLNVRVVNVSSCVHKATDIDYDDFHCKKFYHPADAYNKSKLAQIIFTSHLDKLCRAKNLSIQIHSVHPGIVDTELFENTNSNDFPLLKKIFYKSPEEGSRTVVYAAISPNLEAKGGSYLSNCMTMSPHSAASDAKECQKLFDFTCKLLKIENFGML